MQCVEVDILDRSLGGKLDYEQLESTTSIEVP
jgi:hypothetical protein